MTRVLAIVLATLGLAYACLWWSFQRFYGEFGVSPQDVGMAPSGSASDLAGAALQLGVWLLIVIACSWSFRSPPSSRRRSPPPRGRRRAVMPRLQPSCPASCSE